MASKINLMVEKKSSSKPNVFRKKMSNQNTTMFLCKKNNKYIVEYAKKCILNNDYPWVFSLPFPIRDAAGWWTLSAGVMIEIQLEYSHLHSQPLAPCPPSSAQSGSLQSNHLLSANTEIVVDKNKWISWYKKSGWLTRNT